MLFHVCRSIGRHFKCSVDMFILISYMTKTSSLDSCPLLVIKIVLHHSVNILQKYLSFKYHRKTTVSLDGLLKMSNVHTQDGLLTDSCCYKVQIMSCFRTLFFVCVLTQFFTSMYNSYYFELNYSFILPNSLLTTYIFRAYESH